MKCRLKLQNKTMAMGHSLSSCHEAKYYKTALLALELALPEEEIPKRAFNAMSI